MLRFLIAQIAGRRIRALTLGLGVLGASVSFVLLTGTARTTDVRVTGSVEESFRAAYDILVRPRGSFTQLERDEELVRDNYLGGIFGGISFAQYDAINQVRGVEIAAPIGNVGYILPSTFSVVLINKHLTPEPFQLFRLRSRWLAHNRLSQYPIEDQYIYFSRRSEFVDGRRSSYELIDGREFPQCGLQFAQAQSPFDDPFDLLASFRCFSPRSPGELGPGYPPEAVGLGPRITFPILISAIDPAAEARLLGLNKAIVSGRYLREGEGPRVRDDLRFVPVIAANRTYVADVLETTVERLIVPPGAYLPRVLNTRDAYRFVTRLPARPMEQVRLPAQTFYKRLGESAIQSRVEGRSLFICSYWTSSTVSYSAASERGIAPRTVTNPLSIWQSKLCQNSLNGFAAAPQANRDLQFRRLRSHPGDNTFDPNTNVLGAPRLEVIGEYDVNQLPGFSPLSRVPLETYYPPLLQPANEATRRSLGARPLLPTQNLADYVQQPPLFLTTLEGLKALTNPRFFKGASGRAPISVIRVRVAGVQGPDALSMERIRRVAIQIRERTGLDVDITAGSSPRELLVDLPPGKFGRPPLLLKEGWVKKGVSVSFLEALDRKRLALFSLILFSSGLFLANGVFASVRARRTEIGTLRCLGWSQRALFLAVLGEVCLLGLIAGVVGTLLAVGLVAALSLDVSLATTLLVVPLALALALVSGFLPALRTTRLLPLDAIRPPVIGRPQARRVHGLVSLAVSNLRRLPARTLAGAAGLFLGVMALTLLVGINEAFQGTLVGTLLGEAVSIQIQGLDFLGAAIVIGLAALSVADVLYLNLSERSAELVTLRTVGWRDSHLRRLVALEAVGLALLGSAVGALVGIGVGSLALEIPIGTLALAATLAALGGLIVALLASLAPLLQIRRFTDAAVLADE